jgi:hypothetical protein
VVNNKTGQTVAIATFGQRSIVVREEPVRLFFNERSWAQLLAAEKGEDHVGAQFYDRRARAALILNENPVCTVCVLALGYTESIAGR